MRSHAMARFGFAVVLRRKDKNTAIRREPIHCERFLRQIDKQEQFPSLPYDRGCTGIFRDVALYRLALPAAVSE
jgi:hypothetical protein